MTSLKNYKDFINCMGGVTYAKGVNYSLSLYTELLEMSNIEIPDTIKTVINTLAEASREVIEEENKKQRKMIEELESL